MRLYGLFAIFIVFLHVIAPAPLSAQEGQAVSIPPMRWSHMERHGLWNRAADEALQTHGLRLTLTVPRDIDGWCPHYPDADLATRRQFWIGFLSALAKHESTYKPTAVGGDGRWFGLVQIAPATARGYGCRAGTGEALKTGADNLSCAIRIMATTVARDEVIAERDGRWRGVAADWGPLRVQSKRADMSGWLREQSFCTTPVEVASDEARPSPRRMRPSRKSNR